MNPSFAFRSFAEGVEVDACDRVGSSRMLAGIVVRRSASQLASSSLLILIRAVASFSRRHFRASIVVETFSEGKGKAR